MTPWCYLFATQTCFSAFSLAIIYLLTVHWVKTCPDVWINKKMLSLASKPADNYYKYSKMHDLHFKEPDNTKHLHMLLNKLFHSFCLLQGGGSDKWCIAAIEFQISSMLFQTPLPSFHLPAHMQAPSSRDAVQHLADRFLRTLTGCRQLLVLEKGVSLLVRSSRTCSICAREMWGE